MRPLIARIVRSGRTLGPFSTPPVALQPHAPIGLPAHHRSPRVRAALLPRPALAHLPRPRRSDYADTEATSVVIDLVDAHVWDSSAVATLDTVVAKFAAHGITAEIVGLNAHSSELHTRLTGHLSSSH